MAVHTSEQTEMNLDLQREIYESMVRIREFDTRWHRLFLQGLSGPGHSSVGMEATAAVAGALMNKDDWSYATYRGHGHILAKGVEPRPIMAELLSKSTGLCGGKGGSMHLTSVEHGMMGSYAIIGAHLPIAVGAAMAFKKQKSDRVVLCFFGDGATNIGAFHEALNLAAVWKAPIVFVCENNLYMEYTPIADVTAVKHPAADRASAYGLESIVIDGNDTLELESTLRDAIERARRGEGPSMIEALTYRHGGHASADPAKYRPQEEVEAWLEKDPIPRLRTRLIDAGVAEADLDSIDAQVKAEIEDAADFAVNSPDPKLEAAFTNVWSDGSSAWRN